MKSNNRPSKERRKELKDPYRQQRESDSESCDRYLAESRQRQLEFEKRSQQALSPHTDGKGGFLQQWSPLLFGLLIVVSIIAVLLPSKSTSDPANATVKKDTHRSNLVAEIEDLTSRLSSAESRLLEARYEWNKAKASTEYDNVVRSGVAGTSESLRLAKKQIENPFYEGESRRLEASMKSSMERALSSVETIDQQLKQKRAELTALDTSLNAKNKVKEVK